MPSAVPVSLIGPALARIYGGGFPLGGSSDLSGVAALMDAVAGGAISSSAPPPPAPAPAPGTLPALTLTAASAGTYPWSVGHVFADGDITAAQALATYQLNVLSTWPSGCARFGIVSGVSSLASGSNTITLARGTAPSGSAIATSALQAAMTNPVTVTVSGIGSASWTGTDWLSPFATWASGPVMSSWVYRKPVGSDAHLVAWLEVRMWSNGAVEVLPWIENGYIFVAGGRSVNATYSFVMGGTTRETLTIDLPHHCRTPLVSGTKLSHWLSTDPGLIVKHDTAYMQASEMVPTYGATLTGNDYAGTRIPATYTPLQQGGYASTMGTAGSSEDIGILPDWDAAYVCSNADLYWAGLQRNAYSAGRYGIYFRDESTSKPIRFSQHPTLVVTSGAIGSTGTSSNNNYANQGTGTSPAFWQNSHHPSIGYMAALVTGRYFHVETCQFGATVAYLANTDASTHRDGSKGLLRSYWGANLVRGAAWGLRSLVNALAISPDADPLKTEFGNSWSSNLNYYHQRYVVESRSPLGFVTPYSNINEPNSPYMAQSWMDDFFTSVVGYARGLQVTSTSDSAKLVAFFNWKAKAVVGRAGLTGADEYLYRDIGMYLLAMAPSNSTDWLGTGGPYYTTWGQVYAGTVAYWGNNVAPAYVGDKQIGDGSIRSHNGANPVSYFGNAIPALAYAVRWNVTGALDGWNRIVHAPNWLNFVSDSAGWPMFNIQPASFSLPYSLPTRGSAKLIAAAGAHQAANPGILTVNEFNYSQFGSYGSGDYNPHWSGHGAYMLAGTGGHNHPETFGCVYFDFTTGLWGYVAAVGQADRGSVNEATETNGSPFYEMTGTQIPAPPHPYNAQIVMTPGMGGGPRGSMMYVVRSAVGIGAKGAPVAHKFSLPDGTWSRLTSGATDGAGSPIRDVANKRIYMMPGDVWSFTRLRYLRESDWTYQLGDVFGFSSSQNSGDESNVFLHGRLLILHQGNNASPSVGTFRALDLDNQAAGFTTLNVTGQTSDVKYSNFWVYHEAQGVYYRRYSDVGGGGTTFPQGQTLYKLTPPASNPLTSAWTITAVTIGGDTIPDSFAYLVSTQAYRRLMYLRTLRMLALVTVNGVVLINP